MDIAAMSIGLSQAKAQQQASVSVMKLAMDASQAQAEMLNKLAASSGKAIELAVNPNLGSNIDISV